MHTHHATRLESKSIYIDEDIHIRNAPGIDYFVRHTFNLAVLQVLELTFIVKTLYHIVFE